MPIKTPRLYMSRHGVYYLRVQVPKLLQPSLHKKEMWHSLRTKDPQLAQVFALSYALEHAKVKTGMAGKRKSITDIQSDITQPLKITTPDGFTVDFDATNALEKAEALAFLKDHQPTTPVITEAQRQAWQHSDLDKLRDSEAAFRQLEQAAAAHRSQLLQTSAAPPKKSAGTFSQFRKAYLTLIQNTDLKDRTKKVYAAKLQIFQDYIGESATLEEINAQTILNFQTWLAQPDPVTQREAISARTIDGYTEVISNVYKMTVKKLADNPVEGRLVSKKQRMKSSRKPFTPDELAQIFNPERLSQCDPTDLFVPILGLLTGSRPASICQLRLGDIRREDGIHVISYHDYLEDNSNKTTATNRIVPLHPILEQIGFLRYLQDIRNLPNSNATTLIFPWLNKYEQGYADVPSQRFTAVLKQLGIHVPNVKIFYSLRHTTNQRMKERGVPEDYRAQYIGHENDSVNHRTYGGTTPTKFMLEYVIPHLQFEEVDWAAIHYQSRPEDIQHQLAIAKRRDEAKSNTGKSKPKI